jgi:putative redox protein
MVEATLHFDAGFVGTAHGERAQLPLSMDGEGFVPYELLYSALGSCVHATFLGIAEKMRVTFDAVDYHITGIKREEIPTFLTHCTMTITATNASDAAKFDKAFDLGTQYCSVFNTLKNVAQMTVVIHHQH